MGTKPPIRILDAVGSPGDIGRAHGSVYAEEIKRYTRDRVELVASGLWSGGPMSRGEVLEIAESMIPAHESFDADLHSEMDAMALAAGISLPEAIVVGGFTDFVDTVRAVVGGPLPETLMEDDCTAVIVPDQRTDGGGYFAQTWDMHDTATDHVLLLRLKPTDAPPALVFTTTGCLGQIGMNAEGVCVGINNLVTLDGTRGVAWTSVVRGMLKTANADEALDVLMDANLAGAHNFLIFDRHGVGHNVEAMPSVREAETMNGRPLVHTNHTLYPATTEMQADKAPGLMDSSEARLQKATELMAEGMIDAERLFNLTREPEAICQVASEPYHIESSGAVVMRPATLDFWACWGRPAVNDYQQIEFESFPPDVIAVGPQSGLQYVRLSTGMADAMEELELASFPTADPADLYNAEELADLAEEFPEGSYIGFDGDDRDRPVAAGLGIRVQFDLSSPQHSLKEFVEDSTSKSGDDPSGEWYYGTDVVVRPEYRRRGIGRELYDMRKGVCRDLNLRGIVAGGVIPGYAEHKRDMSADDYIAAVVAGQLYDPTLTFQLENGFEAPCALRDYIADPEVDNWAALIVWHNPDYRKLNRELG